MPGKVNPVMPELINQVAFQVIGNDNTICLASEAGQLELNVMEPVLVFNLLQSISIMNNAFNVFTDYCLEGIEANEQHFKRLCRTKCWSDYSSQSAPWVRSGFTYCP